MTTAYSAEPATEPFHRVTTTTTRRLVNHDSPLTPLVATHMNVTVMPVDTADGIGQCSECAEPTAPGDPAVLDGAVLLRYVSCVNGLVLHRDAVCLACLRGALNWIRSVDIHAVVIEIPRVPGHVVTAATARLEHERRVITQRLGTGDPRDAASLIERWNWLVTQLREHAAGAPRDPFARLPVATEDVPW